MRERVMCGQCQSIAFRQQGLTGKPPIVRPEDRQRRIDAAAGKPFKQFALPPLDQLNPPGIIAIAEFDSKARNPGCRNGGKRAEAEDLTLGFATNSLRARDVPPTTLRNVGRL